MMNSPAPQQAGAPAGAASSLRSWLAVISIAVGSFGLVTTEFLPIGLLTDISRSLGISDGEAGLMVTTPGIAAAIAAPILTVGSGRLDRRFVLWGLTGLLVLSNLLVALAPNLPVILIGRVMLGIGVGGFWTFAPSLGTRLVAATSAGRATAIILAGISAGTVCGVPAGALIGQLMSWRAAFGITSGFAVLVLIAQILLLPPLRTAHAIRFGHLVALLGIPKARIGLIASGLIILGHFAAYTYLRPFLEQGPRLGPSVITVVLLAYGIAGFFGNFLGEAGVARSVRVALIVTACVLGGSLLLAPVFGGGKIAAISIVTAWGFAFGAVPICMQTWMFKAAPDVIEGGSALFITVVQVALAAGSLVGGLTVDHLGISSVLILGGVMSVATAVIVWGFGHDRVVVA